MPVSNDKLIKKAGDMPAFFGSENRPDAVKNREDALRLVKGSKSPTSQQSEFMNGYHAARSRGDTGLPVQKIKKEPVYINEPACFAEDTTGPGRFTVVGYREWSDEYRVRTEVQRVNKDQPPENVGDRVTKILSVRGARKIAESCEYMATKGGYTTFLTLTFDDAARRRIEAKVWESAETVNTEAPQKDCLLFDAPFTRLDYESGRPYTPIKFKRKTTIQKETSRFFDAAQKMYQRGWEYVDDNGVTVKVGGNDGRLNYCWVCEVPDTIDKVTGEVKGRNPHVHVLMQWRVDYRHFQAWAKRIEGIWGQGVAHLEKIKAGEKAGAYMAKAAGYLCKAQGKGDSDQGEVYGNRYNISRDARAPDWVCVGRYELGRMGWLMAEAAAVFDERFGYVKKNRDALVKKLSATTDKDKRQKIGRILEKTREKLKKMPRLSKYQAVLKGEKQFCQFMKWAEFEGEGKPVAWLPEKSEGTGFRGVAGCGVWAAEFFRSRCQRSEKRKWEPFLRDMQSIDYWIEQACAVDLGVYNFVDSGVWHGIE